MKTATIREVGRDTARPDFRGRFGGAIPASGKFEQSAVTILSKERVRPACERKSFDVRRDT